MRNSLFTKYLLLWAVASLLCTAATAQWHKDRKISLNEDGSQYLKFTMAAQVWLRHTDLNPGSTINGFAKNNYTDIGIRRMRMQLYGQIADRVFLYTHIGQNNFNFLSSRKQGFFIHDALGEYEVVRKKLSLGGGLTGWSGLSRFSAPSTTTLTGLDIPLFELSTIDVTDQFLRKLSIYAKGKLGKIDYRFTMAHPLAVQQSAEYSSAVTPVSTFSARLPSMQANGYVQWQFFDEEQNLLPYAAGTYLGAKKVLNFGAGFLYQPRAMWHQKKGAYDTVTTPLRQFAADVFYDAPVNKTKGTAFSAYGAFVHFDFGPGYLRNQAPMNMANGCVQPQYINGAGNGFPAYGTGNVLFAQAAYKLRNNLLGGTTLMPYAAVQHARYHRLAQPMNYVDAGVNWLLRGHAAKLTLALQNRPVYSTESAHGKATLTDRKNALILQYQVLLN